jgi:hypothetical protein
MLSFARAFMRPVPREPRQLLRAIVLCALLLTGLLGDSIHRAQVRHAVCPEHGDLVDVSSHASAAPHSAHTEKSTCQREHVDAGETNGSGHHDHCVLAALPKAESVSDAPMPEFGPEFLAVSTFAVPSTEVVASSFPRYLLAPKNSPPV